MWKELKDNNFKKTKKEFVMKELEGQLILFVISKLSIFNFLHNNPLKNVRVTYQRLMDKVFRDQIKRNMEVYIDDMIVKSESLDQHLAVLVEVLANSADTTGG